MRNLNTVTSNAVLLSTQLYAPYGSSRYTAGPQLSTYTGKGYTGQYSDAVSGLDYYHARYYDPVSGVFLSADSVQGNVQGLNPYAYAGNNPTTSSDPSGEMYVCPECGSGSGSSGSGTTTTGSTSGTQDFAPSSAPTVVQELEQLEQSAEENPVTTAEVVGGGLLATIFCPICVVGMGALVALMLLPSDSSTLTSTPSATPTPSSTPTGPVDPHNTFVTNAVLQGHSTATPTPPTQTGGGSGKPPRPPTKPTAPSPGEPPGRPNIRRMNPQDVRFTQETCSSGGGGYTVEGNIQALQNGSLSPDDLPSIRVFQKQSWMDKWGSMTNRNTGYSGNPVNLDNGEWYTLDNRRLYAFQQAGVTDIPVEDVSTNIDLIRGQSWKFSTQNGGIDIELC